MKIIDTEYTSLNDIDHEIVHFYSEDSRTRVIGHTEPDEDGNSDPIIETYIVVVLHKPDEVTYDYVESRRGRRLGDDVIRGAIVNAIAWEDFVVNHDGYIQWLVDLEQWQGEEPQGADYEDSDIFADEHRAWFDRKPQRPVVDIANCRAVYFQEVKSFDSNLAVETGEPTITYDDDNFIKHTTPTTTPKPAQEISHYHRDNAKQLRDHMKLENIFVHGHYFQVRQEDRNNMDETITFAKRNDRMGDSTVWITAENNPVSLTFHQIEAIKDAYVLRMAELFNQYSIWCAGDMQNPFEFVEVEHD